ncbi:sugar phosphate isomerase/epimerase [Microbulbifer thermotolerans]|uniref:Sugar phosphate isomerase/epimerase n=1 Tax=Microbulbifer thermotolerans TaxID=252514 RepID=A0AB35I344_MICTH|nr:TIM barrel protein [Microbulbifer thermotolerans]MCX2803088.1 sugar phosphate isomerase/epimerase [Microbulbifer thermotolerans]
MDTLFAEGSMQRRRFLQLGALGLAAAGMGVTALAEDNAFRPRQEEAGKIPGLQLYTLRSLMKKNVAGTLAAVAEIGYREVEFSDYFGLKPTEVRRMLDAEGLSAPAVHVPLQILETQLEQALEAAHRIGHRYLVLPWLEERQRGTENFKRLAERCNEWGEKCRAAGLRFAYHNHDFEFSADGGFVPYDWLLENTDPDLVSFEMDLFWIAKANREPEGYFKKYPGRFPLWHLKDMDANGNMVDVGAGVIDFKKIILGADMAGFEFGFVEHDQPDDPLRTASTGLVAVRSWERG